jgi:protein-S-isoprenylcysteine O-methyltransferase Ste14
VNPSNAKDQPGVIVIPPILFAACALAGWVFEVAVPLRIMDSPWPRSLGIALALCAVFLAIWAFWVMKANGTNVRPDRPALTIVRSGPFRFSRNPMYLSLCLLQLALGLMLDSWWPLLFAIPLACILHFGVILREERYLEAKFGEPYLALRRKVRRWL